MSLRQLLPSGKRNPFTLPLQRLHRSLPPFKPLHPPRRFQSTNHSTAQPSKQQARIDRILSRVPKYLRPYTSGLRNAPVSHIVAFLILHEITAIVPLVGLAGLFHYTNWIPREVTEGKYVRDGIEKFGKYFRRKGWFGFSNDGDGDVVEVEQEMDGIAEVREGDYRGSRILVEVATAYAITKVLLPVRILGSVWATPWFARVFVGRVGGGLGRIFGRGGRAVKRSAAAGTGATGAGVVGKGGKGP